MLVEIEEKGQGEAELDKGEDEGEALDEELVLPVHEEQQDRPEQAGHTISVLRMGKESWFIAPYKITLIMR